MLRPYKGNVNDRGDLRRRWLTHLARTRTTKKLAQRIDLNYFKRPTAQKRAKFWLSVGLPAIALAWIGWHGFAQDSRIYSSGRMSGAHAVLEANCAACHVPTAGMFSAAASDIACLSCHDGPLHHAAATELGWLRDVPHRTPRASESCCGKE